MWYGLAIRSKADHEFAAWATELLDSTLRTLILATGGGIVLWHLIVTTTWPTEVGPAVFAISALIALASASALWLLSRQRLLAQCTWLAGLTAAITVAIPLFHFPELAFFYVLLPGIAMVTIGWPGGLIAEGVVGALAWWFVSGSSTFRVPGHYALAIVVGGAFTGLLGWAITHVLLKVTQWSISSYEQARQQLELARDRQVELKQIQEDLIQANRELARLSERLKAAHQAAEEARQAKEQFVANVSHELRTPLNMIIGFSDMIMQTPRIYGEAMPPALLADIAAIRRNSQHLARLVNDVLDLSQIEAGRLALSKEWITIPEIVNEAVLAVRALFESKGLTLETEIAPDLPPVYCDSTRIRQVLLNLLSNAGRFTERGGVLVRAWSADGELLVSVSDTGPGIAPEAQTRLFEPFVQLDSSIHRRHGGSGLGLSISRRFVEMHKGRMWLESQVGIGTTITFSLPTGIAEPPRLNTTDARRWFSPYGKYEYLARTRPSRAPLPGAGPRFVLLEKEPAMERLLRRYLGDVEITVVQDTVRALEELNRSPAKALIVNGVVLQDMPGALGGLANLPLGTPTIACWVPGEAEAAQRLGVTRYLVKPISQETLLGAIEALGGQVRTVLLVDDEPDVLHLFGRMLSNAERGYHVLRARNGSQALNLLRERRPDVMLLDLIMPGIDGARVLEEKKRDPAIRDIPVMVITSRDPAGEPIVSNVLAVTRGGGLSARDILACIEAISEALSPSARTDGRAQPETPGA